MLLIFAEALSDPARTVSAMTPELAAGWVAAIAAGTAALFAAVALPFTRRAANSARDQTTLQQQALEEQRRVVAEQRRPMLWADIREHPEHRSVICLFIGNNGPSTARDVRVFIDPPVVPGAQPLSGLEGLQQARAGISAVPPGRVLTWYLGIGHELLHAAGQPEAFHVELSGKANDGTELSEEFTVRLQDLAFTSAAPGNFEDLVQEFKHFREERKRSDRELIRTIEALVEPPTAAS